MAAFRAALWTGARLLITNVIITQACRISSMNASAPKDIAALLKDERTYDVVPTEVLASMNGLEFMQAMIDGEIPAPPITGTMGFLVTKVEKGYALAEAIPSFN